MSGTEFYSPLDASERILASGRPLAPREFVTLSEEEQEDPHNARLIEEGKLIPVIHEEPTVQSLRSQAEALGIEGLSSMSKADLRKAITAKTAENEKAEDPAKEVPQ